MLKLPSLTTLLVGEIALWAGLCLWVHGPAILCYVALQACTTGVFAFAMHRSLTRHTAAKADSVIITRRTEKVTVTTESNAPVAQAG